MVARVHGVWSKCLCSKGNFRNSFRNFVVIGVWGSGSPRPWGGCSGGSIPPTPTKLKFHGGFSSGSNPDSPTDDAIKIYQNELKKIYQKDIWPRRLG